MANFSPNISNSGGSFVDNPLDLFDNPTYKFTLYMIPEAEIITGKFDSDNKIVIAESGVTTRVAIDKIEISSYMAPGRVSQNTEATMFNFELKEYYGAGLIDQIYIAAKSLGIKNHQKAPYFLKLEFRGRDPVTGSPYTDLDNLVWVWPIFIRKIETEVSTSGAVYNCLGVIYGDIAQTKEVGVLSESINIDADKVGAAITKLQEYLNEAAKDDALLNATFPDEYVLEINAELANLKIVNDPSTASGRNVSNSHDINRDTPTDSGEIRQSSRSINLQKGISIHEAINTIVSSSNEYQVMMKNTESASDLDVTDLEKTKKIHRVFGDVKLIRYDIGRGDYSRRMIYNIQPYEMSTLQTSVSEAAADGKVKTNNLKSKGMIRKKYSYIYTGLNDQVLNFDLKFNFGWYVNIPVNAGLFTQYGATAEGQHISTLYEKFMEIREQIVAASKLVAEAEPGDRSQTAERKTAEIRSQIDTSGLTDEEQQQLDQLLKQAVGSRLPDDQQQAYEEKYAKNQATGTSSKSSATPGKKYVSDFGTNTKITTPAFMLYPVSYRSNRDDNIQTMHNVEQDKGAGRPYVNSMFEQAFSTGGDLVTIEMDIKGDPFWLESKNARESDRSTNSRNAQNSFIFAVRTTDVPDETTGIVNLRNSPFTGVYGVRQVDHNFSSGKFTQKIYGVRDANISPSDIDEDEIEDI